MPLEEAVLTGATAQLRPMLMLVVVVLLGMLPAALARGSGSDIQRPSQKPAPPQDDVY